MATLLRLLCMTSAAIGLWVLGDSGEAGMGFATMLWRRFVRQAERGIGWLAVTRPVRMLARNEARCEAAKRLTHCLLRQAQPSDVQACAVLAVCAVALCMESGLVTHSLLGVMSSAALVTLADRWHVSAWERRQRLELMAKMPGVFRTLATAVESGQTLVQAIEYVGLHEHGLAAESFAKTSLRLRCGMSVEEALCELESELDAPGVGLLVTALGVSQRTGSPLRDLFQRSARLVERQGEFERVLMVRTAQVHFSVRVVCGLPLLMVCLLSLISPDYREGVTSVVGTGCLLAAAGMDVVALVVIRRIMEGVLP